MKKNLLSASTAMFVMIAVITSCKKEEPAAVKPPTGKINGVAYANLDLTNDTSFTIETREFAPSGTKVIAQVDQKDYTSNPAPGVTYEKIVYEATIGNGGAYSFDTIKVYGKEVNVKLFFSDFAYDRKTSSTKTERIVYSEPEQTVVLVANRTKVVDVTY